MGTDCHDCGSWTFKVREGQSKKDIHKPIEALREAEILVITHKTATYPSFLMPYTDPAKDVDVSGQMAHRQVVELGLTQVKNCLNAFQVSRLPAPKDEVHV